MVRIGDSTLRKSIGITLLVGICCGITGLLVDIDHPISFALGWSTTTSRFLHPYALIIGGVIFLACVACIGGLLYRSILRNKKNA